MKPCSFPFYDYHNICLGLLNIRAGTDIRLIIRCTTYLVSAYVDHPDSTVLSCNCTAEATVPLSQPYLRWPRRVIRLPCYACVLPLYSSSYTHTSIALSTDRGFLCHSQSSHRYFATTNQIVCSNHVWLVHVSPSPSVLNSTFVTLVSKCTCLLIVTL